MEKTTKEKIEDLKSLHKSTFDKLGLEEPLFIPRICYRPIGEKDQVVSFFEQDFAKGKDIYTHFVSKGYESEDPQNRLWKWNYNPFYATEYKRSEPHPETGNIRFIVPADELTLIDAAYVKSKEIPVVAKIPFDIEADLPDPDQDLPIDQLTIRDLAAILLKTPVSRKTWLNEIIQQHNTTLPWE